MACLGWGPATLSWVLTMFVGVCGTRRRSRRYGVSLPWCDGGIPLDGEEEVVAVGR